MLDLKEPRMVHPGQGGESQVVPCPEAFFFRKVYTAFKVSLKTFHQKLVIQHFQKGWCKRKGEPEVNTIVQKVLKDPDKGNIRFQHRFMQPRLFEMIFMFRIPDIREMCMEDEKEITLCC